MTGCDTHGELLGGYVLGALSPRETEAMDRHLETCPACAREHQLLAGLPALLDQIEPTDVAPPAPPTALEETVLDRWARERRRDRRSAHEHGRRGLRIGRALSRDADREPRRLGRLRVGAAVAALVSAAAVATVAVVLLLPSADDPYARGTLARGTLASAIDAHGSFTVERVSTGTRVYLEAQRLPSDAYEVWCVRTDGRWVSGGSFRPDASGNADVTLTAAVEPGDYHTVIVTRGGPNGDRGPAVLRGALEY